jgi:hypothetical protein
MSLESKIKALLEGNAAEEELVSEAELGADESIMEDDESAQNASINSGKGRKLDATKLDDPNASKSGDGSDSAVGAGNSKINAGKGKKFEDNKITGEASSDEPNNNKNAAGTDLQKGACKNPVGEHVEALMAGEDLSEDFKTKAGAILEAAIADGVANELDRLDEEYAQKLDEAVEAVRDELVENIDGFLNEMVQNWMQDNELALERGVRTDIVENFVDGLKNLFKENYIEVPEEKYNVLDEQAEKIEELTAMLGESVEAIEQLTTEVKTLSKKNVMESVGEALTDTEYEKFAGLLEGVEFVSVEEFESKAKTIKESYFPKTKRASVIAENDEPVSQTLVEGSMAQYVNALTNPLTFKR